LQARSGGNSGKAGALSAGQSLGVGAGRNHRNTDEWRRPGSVGILGALRVSSQGARKCSRFVGAMSGRVRLGELLVSAGILSREQLDRVLELQKSDGRKLGLLLVERGLVTETQVTQILSQQLSVPWVSLYHIDFSRQLLDLVPQELAEKHCLVPIFVRRVRGLGDTLYVAMDDPTDDVAQKAVSTFAGLPVRTMIAPPSDIRSAIRAYYGGEEPAPPPAAPAPPVESTKAIDLPSVTPEPVSVEPKDIAPVSAPPVSPLPVMPASLHPPGAESIPPSDSPTIEAREVSMPAPPRRKGRRMVTLTLLDGTRVNLPARTSRPPAEKSRPRVLPPADETGGQLTARDLVAALRAISHGADASEILGEKARWEPLFAALLELLLKKHLVADWEFVAEYKKI
jgi:type IV pilus assembly protein PilB